MVSAGLMFPIRDHNPSEKTPYVTIALIVINVAIFLAGLVLIQTDRQLGQFYYDYAMIPARLSQGENLQALVTSVFLHGGILHLAGNMLFLYIFGDNLEEEFGHVGFLLFYLASGIGATLAQFVAEPMSQIPTIGASGAIAGVMGGYLLMFPKARVDVLVILIILIRIIPIPAWLMLGLWFALQLFSGYGIDTSEGGVAYWAHAGGFVIGFVLTVPLWIRRGAWAYWQRTDGHPPHPETLPFSRSRVPRVRKRR